MSHSPTTRRSFLTRGAALMGCSAAAHPFMSTVTFASAPWDQRLVVIILRGAMDGLDVVRPVGDPTFAAVHEKMAGSGGSPALALDGFFALHPALAPLMPLWAKGELGFAHAVSTPYRGKRSHFDGQDMLEAGTGMDVPVADVQDGWLNRILQNVPGLDSQTAVAVGNDQLKILQGAAPVLNWAPDSALPLSGQAQKLLEYMYHDDPLFRETADEAIALAQLAELDESTPRGAALTKMLKSARRGSVRRLAAFAGDQLAADSRIAAFSLAGWDTHKGQADAIRRPLGELADTILTLKAGLGGAWSKTAVLAMTEFGRTVRVNGSGGTDHGTGGAMLLAGGALNGGRVLGRWPGLAEADLLDRRDLMPTGDVRAYAAWALRGLFGFERGLLERTVFPGLDMGADPGFLL